MKRDYRLRLRPYLLLALFSFILIIPQWLSRGVILGTDSVFHYNRFYEAAMQIKHWNFSYFLSISLLILISCSGAPEGLLLHLISTAMDCITVCLPSNNKVIKTKLRQ